ncbi:MAG: tetratricopeptide repeat protein [Myxococcota bacterium]
MADKNSSVGNEPSDLFQVEEAGTSISPVDKIVLPPEEQLKRRIQRLVIAALVALAVLYFIYLVLGWIHASRVSSALDDVIEVATPQSIDEALTLVRSDAEDGGANAVRARLLATAALGGNLERLEEAKAMLADAPQDDDPDRRIGRMYVMLAEGNPRAALAESEKPAKYDDQKAAFLRGRAMIAMARGQWPQAVEDAKSAAAIAPDAPAPAALLALATAKSTGTEDGLAVLEGTTDTPAVRIARARILAFDDGNPEEILQLTASVLGDDQATPLEKSWASLIEGVLAYQRGAIDSAYGHARTAAELDLRMDEALIVSTAQLFLALGQPGDARRLLKRLSTGPSSDLASRAHVIAWWYAGAGDDKAAIATLEGAGLEPEKPVDSAFRALTLAEVSKLSSGTRPKAEALYRQATDDPAWGVAASNALAQMLAEDGKPDEALTVLEAGLAAHPNHLALVDAATDVALSTGDIDKADTLTREALDAFPEEGWAHGSRGRILLAKREATKAVAELDRAVELSPKDARLLALRGDAARAVGDVNRAKASYESALAIDPAQPRALSGLLALLIDTGDFARAGEVMETMDSAKVRGLRADEQRIRYLVRTGAGQAGLTTLRNAVARHSQNAGLRLAGARVYLQAERYASAASYYQQAKRLGADARTAETGLALAQVYDRRRLGAEKTLERAAEVGKDAEEPPPPPSTLVQAWELVVKAHLALADQKRGLAVRYAKRAAELVPNDADVFLLQADIEVDRDRPAERPLRLAAIAPIPMPVALGRLAYELGPTEEGCALAASYLKANRTGKYARKARDVARKCEAPPESP